MKKLTRRRRDAESEAVSTGIEQEAVNSVHSARLRNTSLCLRVSAFFVFLVVIESARTPENRDAGMQESPAKHGIFVLFVSFSLSELAPKAIFAYYEFVMRIHSK